MAVSVPYLKARMFCDLNLNSFLREHEDSIMSKTSLMILRASFILTLNISISNFRKKKKRVMSYERIKKFFFAQVLKTTQFKEKDLAPNWPFCREILDGAQMSAFYLCGYPEAFHIYYWRWPFHQCKFEFLVLSSQ